MKPAATYLALSIFVCSSSVLVLGVKGVNDVSCYVCMGRDMESCTRGVTICSGYCYKVVDKGHDLISKGCATDVDIENPSKPEKSDWSPLPHIKLYWTNADNRTRPPEHVRGHTYFCKADMCNAGRRNLVAFHFPVIIAFIVVAISPLRR